MSERPTGEEREIQFLGGAAIDGAPVTYIVVLAAVVAALAFIPFSIVLASGGSFPLSQGIWHLLGWILGPIAGAVASGIGTLLGVFLAPHTAGVPAVSVYGAVLAGLLGGSMVLGEKRKNWWIWLSALVILSLLVQAYRAVFVNGVRVWVMAASMSRTAIAIALYMLPTRKLIARWVSSDNLGQNALGNFVGTWVVSNMWLQAQSTITYWMFNWPEEVWITLIPIVLFESLTRSLVGLVIGTGVIAGLRAIGLVKPKYAIY
jgi:hypothetical protein